MSRRGSSTARALLIAAFVLVAAPVTAAAPGRSAAAPQAKGRAAQTTAPTHAGDDDCSDGEREAHAVPYAEAGAATAAALDAEAERARGAARARRGPARPSLSAEPPHNFE